MTIQTIAFDGHNNVTPEVLSTGIIARSEEYEYDESDRN